MEVKKRSLVRSALLASVASAAIPATLASADMTLYSSSVDFESDATGSGLSHLYTETFEENDITGAYAMPTSPLTHGVPNAGFPTGLDAEGLTLASNDGSNLFAIVPSPDYWPNITSTMVGTLEAARTVLEFGGEGVDAVGMIIGGIDTFTTAPPDEVFYVIYDVDGVEVEAGMWPTPDSASGSFFGVVSTTPIGSIELRGTRFESLDVQEYVDDVQGWRGGGAGVPGDVDGNGVVDFQDLLAVLSTWGPCPGCPADLDGNGIVDFQDLLTVLSNWS